jgi:hypothetical protein
MRRAHYQLNLRPGVPSSSFTRLLKIYRRHHCGSVNFKLIDTVAQHTLLVSDSLHQVTSLG